MFELSSCFVAVVFIELETILPIMSSALAGHTEAAIVQEYVNTIGVYELYIVFPLFSKEK